MMGGFDKHSADRIAKTVKAVEAMAGQKPSRAAQYNTNLPIIGVVVDRGPEEEPDFNDERYWIQSAHIANESGEKSDAAIVEPYSDETAWAFVRIATNLAEVDLKSHSIAIGQTVLLRFKPDKSESKTRRWFFIIEPSELYCIVRDIPDPEAHYIDVQLVRMVIPIKRGEPWDGRMQAFGGLIRVSCYPVMKGSDYSGLVVSGGNKEHDITRGHPVLQLDKRMGVWWAHPYVKRGRVVLDGQGQYAFSDCNPLKMVQG